MQNKKADVTTEEQIRQCLKETYPNRKAWIAAENLSISEVFRRYPRLLDYNGRMVCTKFIYSVND